MTALGYIRISIADQSAYSLASQEQRIRDYCASNGLTLLDVYKDQGESSYTFDRPDFRALESFIKKNTVSHLIVADYDRFSRNLAEALLKIRELQNKYNIKVLSVNEPINTDISDPTVFMMTAFKLMMAENELHGIRKRTRAGIKQANLQGRFVNKAPFGYDNKREDGKPIIVPNDDAVKVCEVFRLFNQGLSHKQIGQILSIKGKSNSIIQRILTNRVYLGEVKVSGTNNWIKGIHPALVSNQDFWMAQEKLTGKEQKTQPREEVPLRGALRCFCGKKLTAGKSKGKKNYYWYYFCTEHKNYYPAIKLHNQFNQILESISLPEELIEQVKSKTIERINQQLANYNTDALKAELKKVQIKIESIERKYLESPDLSDKVYKKTIGEYREKERILLMKLSEANTSIERYYDALNRLIPKLSNLKFSFDEMPIDRKRLFIDAVFNSSLSYSNGYFRTPPPSNSIPIELNTAKEKGLLKIEQPLPKIGITPVSSEIGT